MLPRATVERITAISAIVVAATHLYWGIPRFVAYAAVGTMPDPRPLAFVLSGHAILITITLVSVGVVDGHRTYAPGMALMLVHVGGYAAWHTVLRHGVPGSSETPGHGHGYIGVGDALRVVLEHALNSPLALVSKIAELSVLFLLVGLYITARRPES